MLSRAGTPHIIVAKAINATSLPLSVVQESQDVKVTDSHDFVAPQSKQKRPVSAVADHRSSHKQKKSRSSEGLVAVNLTGSQEVCQPTSIRSTTMKTELSWYHSEWAPVDEQLGHKVTMELIPTLKQRNAKMKCKHCKGERSFNPTTRYKDHLLSSCKEFAETETYRSEIVQRHLQEMKSKIARKAKARALRSICFGLVWCTYPRSPRHMHM